jgi:uncharacterized protein (DUF433 family)
MMDLPDFLHVDPDGEIRLKGHRIRLIDVAARYDEGHSAEGIVEDYFPTLSLALVYKVIGFYLDHETEVRELIERNAEKLAELAAQPHRPTPSHAELRRRMEAIRRAQTP